MNLMRAGYLFIGLGLGLGPRLRRHQTVTSCALVVLLPAVIPWRYVWQQYVRADGEAWRR